MSKKTLILLAVAVLVLTVSIGTTLAYLTDNTAPLTNAFKPIEHATQLQETVSENQKSAITVTNTKDVPCYIRLAVVGLWMNEDGKIDAAATPWAGLSAYNTTDWALNTDGYYYYKHVLEPGATTQNLLTDAFTQPTDGAGNTLEVRLLSQSLQAFEIQRASGSDGIVSLAEFWGVSDSSFLAEEVQP